MQIKPYPSRSENLPVALPEPRGQLVERNGFHNWNGQSGHTAPPMADAVAVGPPPSYLEVMVAQIQKRWKLLAIWMAVTAVAAGLIVFKFAKPMYKAEGSLYYSPKYNYSNRPLYTPPNIQTILALAKSPAIVDDAAKEAQLNPVDVQSKLSVAIVKQSEIISVAYESADKAAAETVCNRVLALAIDQYDILRRRLSDQAIIDLDGTLEKTRLDELNMRRELNEMLGRKGIFDLPAESSAVIGEISQLKKEIADQERDRWVKQADLTAVEFELNRPADKNLGKKDGFFSDGETSRMLLVREYASKLSSKEVEVTNAEIQLTAASEEYKKVLEYPKAYSVQEISALKVKVITLKNTVDSGKREIAETKETIETLKNAGVAQIPAQQLNFEKVRLDATLKSIPIKIRSLEAALIERQAHQKFLQSLSKEALQKQQEIDTLQQRRNALSLQKQEHEKLEANKMSELTIHAIGSAGNAPTSSNHLKLGLGTFGLSILLFISFIALFDMPRMPTATVGAEPNYGPPQPTSQLPVPWQHPAAPMRAGQPPTRPMNRNEPMSNEHLRALAERISLNATADQGKIVLFTPTAEGLCVENLLGDLACYLTRNSGRVLVFEARTHLENPAFPAWTGPSAREVSEQLDHYLDGQTERSSGCFAETLISSIDYARSDLAKHLQSVMSMYRFRRLITEMKERYSLVLMITPQRFHGDDDDVFTTLGEGIVVVINQDADPASVEEYLRGFSASQTPVYGAFTVAPGQTH